MFAGLLEVLQRSIAEKERIKLRNRRRNERRASRRERERERELNSRPDAKLCLEKAGF